MLKEILAISGKSGLFKLVSQGKNCLIVESLKDGKKISVHALGGVMSMEDVAIYTEEDTVSMADVFRRIRDKEDAKSLQCNPKKMTNDELKTYFDGIVPDYDKDRVYISDIKKTLSWYNEMVDNDLLGLIDTDVEEENNNDSNKEVEDTSK